MLRVFLIGDLLATAVLPPILLGLVDSLYFINWIDALTGGIGGLLGIFIFGSIFYKDAKKGIELLGLPQGLYDGDYSVLGAFIVAPLSSIFFTFLSFGIRLGVLWAFAKIEGEEFKFPKKPEVIDTGEEFKQGDEESVQDDVKGNAELHSPDDPDVEVKG